VAAAVVEPAIATGAVAAREIAPAEAPRPAPRPRLRVVDEAARRAQLARQRRARLVLALVVAAVVGSVFALAGAHAYLVSGQGQLDRLNAEVAEARSHYSQARLQVAELGAPARIVRVAQDRLGMVPPAGVRYLAPSNELALQVGAIGQVGSADQAPPGQPWASIKPYLGSAR
jgi:cell division protein FtsL